MTNTVDEIIDKLLHAYQRCSLANVKMELFQDGVKISEGESTEVGQGLIIKLLLTGGMK